MGNLNWCFDAAAGVMLVLFLIYGIRKGASRTFVPFIVNIVFVVLASSCQVLLPVHCTKL